MADMNSHNGRKLIPITRKEIMLLKICSALLIGTIMFTASLKGQTPYEVLGEATNGLIPHLYVGKYGTDWSVDMDYVAQTNFGKNTWLKTTNHLGSRLRLWLTNGAELTSTNPSVLAAFNLPPQTTVPDLIRGVHPSSRWGLQWLPVLGQGMETGKSYTSAGLRLSDVFDISSTNDVILQISPLIYKVETNEVTAHLVEFPPIKMKLMANGEVKKIEEK